MSASGLFSIFNLLAMAGWLILALSVALRHDWLRDSVAGSYIPVLFQ